MKPRRSLAVSVGFALMTIATSAVAQNTAAGAKGEFVLKAMTHTPDWPSNAQVSPWDGRSEGTFVYRAIPCSGNAPLNNISSNLPTYGGRIPGARSPASTRAHPMTITVKSGVMSGTIDFTVCKLGPGPTNDQKPDTERDRIRIEFAAKPISRNADELGFKGEFKIVGGTGRYASLSGSGVISGYMFCYDPRGCVANESKYRDMQFLLEGSYSDPAFAP